MPNKKPAYQALLTGTLTQGFSLIAISIPASIETLARQKGGPTSTVQVLDVQDPAALDDDYKQVPNGQHIAYIGCVGGGGDVYGPFVDGDDATEFAESNSEDSDYFVFSLKT